MNLGQAIEISCTRYPDNVAIVDGHIRLGYEQWHTQILAVAGGFRDLGLTNGDHLVVVMRNRHEMATLYWAAQMVGVVFTPVSWRQSPAEIEYCMSDCHAATLAYDGSAEESALSAAAVEACELPRSPDWAEQQN